MRPKNYKKKQIEGHKDTERYALMNPGYLGLMKWLRTKIPKGKHVLEIGCNTGYECIAMRTKSRFVTGIDIGLDFIEKATKGHYDNVRFIAMDMHNLRFNDERFDCVYANNTIEHTYDPKKVLSEIVRVLKTGGEFVVCIPSDYKNPHYISHENWNKDLHLWKPTFEEFNNALVDAGFKFTCVSEIDAEEMFGLKNEASKNCYLVGECRK